MVSRSLRVVVRLMTSHQSLLVPVTTTSLDSGWWVPRSVLLLGRPGLFFFIPQSLATVGKLWPPQSVNLRHFCFVGKWWQVPTKHRHKLKHGGTHDSHQG